MVLSGLIPATAYSWGVGGSLLGWKAQDSLTHLSVNWCCLWLGHLGFLPCDLSFSTKLVQLLYMTVSGQCSKKEKWKLQDLLRPSLGSYVTYFPYIILMNVNYDQPRFLVWGNRPHFFIGGTAMSCCKGVYLPE